MEGKKSVMSNLALWLWETGVGDSFYARIRNYWEMQINKGMQGFVIVHKTNPFIGRKWDLGCVNSFLNDL